MENGKRFVKIDSNDTADKGKSTESKGTRGENNVHTEGTPKVKFTKLLEYKKRHRSYKRNNEGIKIKVEKSLAIYKVGFTRLAVCKITRAKLVTRNGEIIHKLVVCLDDSLAVSTRVFFNIESIDLCVVEGAHVDRKPDRNRYDQNNSEETEKSC